MALAVAAWNAAPRAEALVIRLRDISTALDIYLGDTDPNIPSEWTDEDIRAEDPVFWACKEINRLIHDLGG